ncbi:MAG: hypothetical protein AB1750_15185, partial [Chloroflexota bacterium]
QAEGEICSLAEATFIRCILRSMLTRLKDFLIGPPLPTRQLHETKLNKIRALAAFSPDALSSIAYANQEIYLGLAVAGSAGLILAWPIGLAITSLLVVVALSYYQTIQGYPSGGGSYVVIPISGVHRGIVGAVDYARAISRNVTAVYVELEAGDAEAVRKKWNRLWPDVPLAVVQLPYRSIIQPLLDFLDETDAQNNDGQLAAVILPEFVPAKWWQALLHNQTAWLLKAALVYHRNIYGRERVIIDVPYHLRK